MLTKKRNRYIYRFIIIIFVFLYLFTSTISMIHVIDFFELSNSRLMSILLALAFELGAAASLASIVIMDRMNKFIIWSLFILLTTMQMMGNMYNAYVNLQDYQLWIELFGLADETIVDQKRIISTVSGAILPIIALGFIKALVDYIKPTKQLDKEQEHDIFDEFVNEKTNQNSNFLAKSDETKKVDEKGIDNVDFDDQVTDDKNLTGKTGIDYTGDTKDGEIGFVEDFEVLKKEAEKRKEKNRKHSYVDVRKNIQ